MPRRIRAIAEHVIDRGRSRARFVRQAIAAHDIGGTESLAVVAAFRMRRQPESLDQHVAHGIAPHAFNLYPVLKIHATTAVKAARNTSVITRLISTLTSEIP